MGRLAGRTALITGAARGMGEATARLFAAEGANVVICDILPEGEETARSIGDNAMFIRLEVSDEQNWISAVAAATERFGPIRALVNNAGVVCMGELLALDYATFERTLQINLGGAFLGIKTVAPGMIAAGGGSIVNISSTEGLQGTNSLGGYAASKWGVRGLTKVAALELSFQGVRVNSVHPGPINTDMGNPGHDSMETLNRLHASLPIGRIGQPSEVAAVSLFLASDESSFVTGAEIAADGGMTVGNYLTFLPGIPPLLAEQTRTPV